MKRLKFTPFKAAMLGIAATGLTMASMASAAPKYSLVVLDSQNNAEGMLVSENGDVVSYHYEENNYGEISEVIYLHQGGQTKNISNESGVTGVPTAFNGDKLLFNWFGKETLSDISGQVEIEESLKIGYQYELSAQKLTELRSTIGESLGFPVDRMTLPRAISDGGQLYGSTYDLWVDRNDKYEWGKVTPNLGIWYSSGVQEYNVDKVGEIRKFNHFLEGYDFESLSTINAINSDNKVVGVISSLGSPNIPFYGSHFEATVDLSSLVPEGNPVDMNDNGVIIGSTPGENRTTPFILKQDSNGFSLHQEDVVSEAWATFTDINNNDVIVGSAFYSEDAVIFSDGELHLLQDLLDESAAGWEVKSARSINDAGQIAATVVDTNGEKFAALLNPKLSCDVAAASHVSHFSLDETSGVSIANSLNDSTGSYPAEQEGTSFPQPASGKVKGAKRFDGTNHIEITSGVGPDGHKNFSFDAWIKLDDATNQYSQTILSSIGGSNANGYQFSVVDGKLRLSFTDITGSPHTYSDTQQLESNKWHHVAVSVKRNTVEDGGQFYVDGEATGTFQPWWYDWALSANSASGGGKQRIGAVSADVPYSRYEPRAHFTGIIDEVNIYQSALSAEQVQAIFDADANGICGAEPTARFPSMHVVGSFNRWSVDATPMELVENNQWKAKVALRPGDQFKFVPEDWSLSFGDGDANGVADSNGGGNIQAPSSEGEYVLSFNDDNNVYEVEEDLENRAPVANAGQDQTVRFDQPVISLAATATDPDNNIGSIRWYYPGQAIELSSTNTLETTFQNPGVGSYTFFFEVVDSFGMSSTDSVTVRIQGDSLDSTYPTMHLVGNFNGWSTSATPLTLVSNYIWQTEVELTAGTSVKFVPKDWSLSFGDRDGNGVADSSGGGNIVVPNQSGNYLVTFNDQSKAYSLTPNVGPQAPKANAGSDKTVKVGTEVTLSGAASTDADNDIVRYSWDNGFGSGETVSKVMSSIGTFNVTLTVTDAEGNSDTDTVRITVQENQAPVVNAGSDQSVVLTQSTINLNGTATDSDGSIGSISWIQTGGPSVSINNASSLNASFSHAGVGNYHFELIVRDNDYKASTDSVTISVVEKSVTSTYPSMHLVGNFNGWSTTATPMTLVGDYTWKLNVTLASGSTVKFVPKDWSLSFGDRDRNGVADSNGGGNIQVSNGTGEYEVRFNDQTKRYSLTRVLGPQAPTANAGNDITIEPGKTIIFDGSNSSDADGSIVSYQWSSSAFADDLSGVSPTKNFPNEGVFQVTLTVTDNDGQTAQDTMRVTVKSEPLRSTHSTMNAVGSLNGWSIGANPMVLVDDYTWQAVLTFQANDSFKFVPQSWSLSYGDNDRNGIADTNGGGNIRVNDAGNYIVRFNDQTRQYSLTKM